MPTLPAIHPAHINLVYAAALRQTNNPDQSADITQAVFLVLAQKTAAGKPPPAHYLTAWLLKVTGYAVKESRRRAATRARHEYQAALQKESYMFQDPPNADLLAALDSALLRLRIKDRELVARRYLEGQSLTQIASALAIPENTAGRRISRALEKLRRHLASKGILAPAAALTAVLASQSLLSAPAATAAAITAATPLTPVSASISSIVKGVTKMMKLTAMKFACVACTGILLIVCAGVAVSRAEVVSTPVPDPAAAAATTQRALTFREQYRLKAGEVVKLVKPPFAEDRMAFYWEQNRAQNSGLTERMLHGDLPIMHVEWNGDVPELRGNTAGLGITGYPADYVFQQLLHVTPAQVEGERAFLHKVLNGDLVVRGGATTEEYQAGLSELLRIELGQHVQMQLATVEREVIIIAGELKWLPSTVNGHLEIPSITVDGLYANVKSNRKFGGGSLPQLAADISTFLDRQVIFEVTMSPGSPIPPLSIPMAPDPGVQNVELALKQIEQQTGLKSHMEKRKVTRLMVEKVE